MRISSALPRAAATLLLPALSVLSAVAAIPHAKLGPLTLTHRSVRAGHGVGRPRLLPVAPKPMFFADAAAPVVNPAFPVIVPMPKEMEISPAYMTFRINHATLIVLHDRASAEDRRAAVLLQADIQKRFDLFPIIVEARNAPAIRNAIVIGEPESAAGGKLADLVGDLPPAYPEGYTLAVSPGVVIVAGRDRQGSMWGVETLLRLLSVDADGPMIRPAIIHDWPIQPVRSTPMPPGARLTADRERWMDRVFARLKFNIVSLGTDAGPGDAPSTETVAFARDRGIDIRATPPPNGADSHVMLGSDGNPAPGYALSLVQAANRLWNGTAASPLVLTAGDAADLLTEVYADPAAPSALRARVGYTVDLGESARRVSPGAPPMQLASVLGTEPGQSIPDDLAANPSDPAPRLLDGVRYSVGAVVAPTGPAESGAGAMPAFLPLGRLPAVRGLRFLVAASRTLAVGTVVGTITITTGEGRRETIDLIYGKNIAATTDAMVTPDASLAWTGPLPSGRTAALRSVAWNAVDGALVSSATAVTITSAIPSEGPLLLAITALTE